MVHNGRKMFIPDPIEVSIEGQPWSIDVTVAYDKTKGRYFAQRVVVSRIGDGEWVDSTALKIPLETILNIAIENASDTVTVDESDSGIRMSIRFGEGAPEHNTLLLGDAALRRRRPGTGQAVRAVADAWNAATDDGLIGDERTTAVIERTNFGRSTVYRHRNAAIKNGWIEVDK